MQPVVGCPDRALAPCCTTKVFNHSLPHCWRHKTPIIFRATPSGSSRMEQKGLRKARAGRDRAHREDGVAQHGQSGWVPAWGKNRIQAMVENRPDWCISRQRTWGVPISLFVHKETQALHPESMRLMEGWPNGSNSPASRPGGIWTRPSCWAATPTCTTKVPDTLDVWFDSGSTTPPW